MHVEVIVKPLKLKMETKNSQRLMHIAVTNHWKIKEKWLTLVLTMLDPKSLLQLLVKIITL